jgi:hypothetical protein
MNTDVTKQLMATVHDGHAYRINTRIGSGVRHDILISTINELNAILKLYSRVFLTRFDLHLLSSLLLKQVTNTYATCSNDLPPVRYNLQLVMSVGFLQIFPFRQPAANSAGVR